MKPNCKKCRHHHIYKGELCCRCGFEPFIGKLYNFIPPMPYSCIQEADAIYPLDVDSNFSKNVVELSLNFDL